MPRLRPRGPPARPREAGVAAVLRLPGLALAATADVPTRAAAILAMPGLAITARPTLLHLPPVELDMPGLAVTAAPDLYAQAAATLAMPGLALRADFLTAALAMPGLAIPRAIVSGPGTSAVLAMPGLDVRATVTSAPPARLSAALAMPGLAIAATLDPSVGTFRLAPDYRIDWAKMQAVAAASEVQIGAPVSNGVRISGGPGGSELVGNIADWSKNKSGPGWTATFTLKKTDGFVPPAGDGAAFLDFYFGTLGDGTVVGAGPIATLAMPGLALTARADDTIAVRLAFPGLALLADFFGAVLAMPGLDVPNALVADIGAGPIATLAMPGLLVTAPVSRIQPTLAAAALAMPGLDVPNALVADIATPAAVLAMPGLLVTATATNVRLSLVTAALAMPGLDVTATVVLDWTVDVNLAGQVAFESPNGVVGQQDFNQLFYGIYGGTGATFGNIAPPVTGGMTLGGGTTGNADANNVLMDSRVRQQGDFVASFATKLTSSAALPGGQAETGIYFYFGLAGNGSAGHPSQVYTWDQGVAPSTTLLKANATGCLIPLYFRNASGAQTTVFARVIDGGGNATLVTGTTTGAPAFVQNAAYTWTVTRAGNTLTIAQTGAATSTTTITSPLIGQLADSGSFAFLVQPGRVVEITRFTFVGTAGSLAGLLTGGRPNIWPSSTVSFGFPTAAYPWPKDGTYTDPGAGYQRDLDSVTTVADAALKAATRAALAAWTAAAGVTFVDKANIATPTGAQIKVVYSNVVGAEGATDANTFGPFAFGAGETDGRDGVVMIRADYVRAWPNFSPGGYGFQALMHELGHALGLRHPPFATPLYPYAQTIMNPDTSREPAFATAPRPLDGTALQILYGLAPGAAAVFGGGAASGLDFPVDMAAWPPSTEPARPLFAAHATGARLSFFVQTAAAPGEVVDPDLVVIRADGSTTPIPSGGAAPTPTMFVATTGSDANTGRSAASPFATWAKAFQVAVAGDVISIKAGTYATTANTRGAATAHDGTAAQPITVIGDPAGRPVLDCAGLTGAGERYGIEHTRQWWVFENLEVANVPQRDANNLGHGWYLHDCRNLVLRAVVGRGCGGPGGRLGYSDPALINTEIEANVLMEYCDFRGNYDALSAPDGGNADGFDFSLSNANCTGVEVRYCRFFDNSDDGADTFNSKLAGPNNIHFHHNLMFRNGFRPGTLTRKGDGRGWKGGGSTVPGTGNHLVHDNKSWDNAGANFDTNDGPGPYLFYNNTAAAITITPDANHYTISDNNAHRYRNNISFGPGLATNFSDWSPQNFIHDHNSFDIPMSVVAGHFLSVDPTGTDGPRGAGYALPRPDFLALTPAAPERGAGVNVGLPFTGSAPDLGAGTGGGA